MAAHGVSLSSVERMLRAQMGAAGGWEALGGHRYRYVDPATEKEAIVTFDMKKLRKEALRFAEPTLAVPHIVRQKLLEAQSGFWLVRAAALTITALAGVRKGLSADVIRFDDPRLPEGLQLTVFAPDAAKGLRPVSRAEFDSWEVAPDELIEARRDEMLGNFQNFHSEFYDHGVRCWKDPTKVGFAVGLLPWIQTISEFTFGEWTGGVLVAIPDHFQLLVCPADERTPEAEALMVGRCTDPILPLHYFDGSEWSSVTPVPAPEGSA